MIRQFTTSYRIWVVLGLASCLAISERSTANAQSLALPAGAMLVASDTQSADSIKFLVGPAMDAEPPGILAKSDVSREAWLVAPSGAATADIMETVLSTLPEQGYAVRFACSAELCGGFDFRYAMDLLPEPEMHVDLGDFQYALAEELSGPGMVALVVSRSGQTAHIHIKRTGSGTAQPQEAVEIVPAPIVSAATLPQMLEAVGYAVVEDVSFAPGTSELTDGPLPSLEQLAQFMRDNPGARISFVGHTDADGALEPNVALSERRAAAVAQRFISEHGISGDRVGAQGVGFLAPRATNETEEGKTANRRVEVILLESGTN